MSQVTIPQIIKFLQRTQLDPGHADYISCADMQAILEKRVMPRDQKPGEPRVFDLTDQVEAMIQAGCHKVANHGEGMSADEYRNLWPKTITQPPEFAGRFDEVLLVDHTIKPEDLIKCARIEEYANYSDCRDLVERPKGEDGESLNRYIAFVQTGRKNLGKSVRTCRENIAEDEVGLVTFEGLHLPIQHQSVLRERASCDLPGSAHGEVHAPYVSWFGGGRPWLDAHHMGYESDYYGSASRGSVVVPVS